MGYANHIGRVGALAVALGIGAAVATPGVAWADDPGSPPPATDTDNTQETQDTTSPPSSSTPPADRPDPGEVIRRNLERTVGTVRKVLTGVVTSSGGALTSTHRTGSGASNGNVPDVIEDGEGSPVSGSPAEDRSLNRQRRSLQADEQPGATTPVSPLTTTTHQLSSAVDNFVTHVRDAVEPRVESNRITGTPTDPGTAFRNHVAPQALGTLDTEEPEQQISAAPEPGPVVRIVSGFLSAIGLNPSATDSPVAPVSGSTILGALELVRREIEHLFVNKTPDVASTPTSLTVDQDDTTTFTLPAYDADGDRLTYTVADGPDHGELSDPVYDASTRTYTYTYTADPNAPTAGTVDDHLVLTASDEGSGFHLHGFDSIFNPTAAHTDTVSVNVDIAVADGRPSIVGAPIPVNGQPYSSPVLSGDGRHAYQTSTVYDADTDTYTTEVVEIDTETGQRIGSTPVSVDGTPSGRVVLDEQHKRAYQTTTSYDQETDTYTTRVAVIDTETGALVGTSPVEVTGDTASSLVFSDDGKRAVISTYSYDSSPTNSTTYTTRVAVINTETGALVRAQPVEVAGSPNQFVLNDDGSRAVQTTVEYDDATDSYVTRVAVVDTQTGNLVRAVPVEIVGDPDQLILNDDGDRAIQTTRSHDDQTDTYTTRVAVIDTETGNLVGGSEPITIEGQVVDGGVVFSRDRSRAVVTTQVSDQDNDVYTARVAVIDTDGGTILGGTRVIENAAALRGVQVSPDGKDAYQVLAVVDPDALDDPDYDNVSTQLLIIGMDDGELAGAPITDTGAPGFLFNTSSTQVMFDEDRDDRAYLFTYDINDVDGDGSFDPTDDITTRLIVIDTEQHTALGDPVVAPGFTYGLQKVSDDRKALITLNYPYVTNEQDFHTTVTIVDTENGGAVGAPVALEGVPTTLKADKDGRQLVVAAIDPVDSNDDGEWDSASSHIAIIDLQTGALAGGHVIDVPGVVVGTSLLGSAATFNDAGDRVILPAASVAFDEDGNTTFTDYGLIVVDAENGAVLSQVPIPGEMAVGCNYDVCANPSAPVFDSSGRYAYQTSRVLDPVTDTYSTVITVIDTSDGTTLDDPIEIEGEPVYQSLRTSDGSRILQTVRTTDSAGNPVTKVVVIDTESRASIGPAVTVNGNPTTPIRLVSTSDGVRALQTTTNDESHSTAIVVIDTETGQAVADPIVLSGRSYPPSVALSVDGSRAYADHDVYDEETDTYQSAVTIVDTAGGEVVGGGPIVLGGATNYSTLSPDKTRLYRVTTSGDAEAGTATTSFTSIDLAEGSVVGDPVTTNGEYSNISFNSDRTQAYVTTRVHNPETDTYTYYVTVVNTGAEPAAIAV